MAKKKYKFGVQLDNYRWMETQATERGISMADVLNQLLAEKRGQSDPKLTPSVAPRGRIN
jgi:hypothetical protein